MEYARGVCGVSQIRNREVGQGRQSDRRQGGITRPMDSVLIVRDGAIATVTLNKPDRLNALDRGMWEALGNAMHALSDDDALRCVVLRGAGGKAFAAGADIAEFATERASSSDASAYGAL